MRVLPLTLLATLGLAASASAWSAPQNVSEPHLFVDTPAVTVGGNGDALMSWFATDRLTPRQSRSVLELRTRTADGRLLGRRIADDPGEVGAYAQTRALLALSTPLSRDRTRLQVLTGGTDGRFRRSVTIAVRPGVRSAHLSVAPDGTAALAWFEDRGVSNDRVYVAVRRRGRAFGPPRLLHTDRVRSVGVAAGVNGGVVVAWEARGVIRARELAPRVTDFAATETLRSDPAFGAHLRCAIDSRGRAYVAWSAQRQSEGDSSGPEYVEIAVRPAGRPFRGAVALDGGAALDDANEGIALTLAGGGTAAIAWSAIDPTGNARVRAALSDSSGRFSRVTTLSSPGRDAVDPAIAASASGDVAVAWTAQAGDSGGQIQASVTAAPGGAFGPPEPVSADQEARVPALAYLPDGHLLALWSNRPGGSHPAGGIDAIQTYAQVAIR